MWRKAAVHYLAPSKRKQRREFRMAVRPSRAPYGALPAQSAKRIAFVGGAPSGSPGCIALPSSLCCQLPRHEMLDGRDAFRVPKFSCASQP